MFAAGGVHGRVVGDLRAVTFRAGRGVAAPSPLRAPGLLSLRAMEAKFRPTAVRFILRFPPRSGRLTMPNTRSSNALALLFVLAPFASASAQSADPNASIAALRNNWQGVVANITTAAEELTEADYAYRPVALVRTFGQLVGHVAGSQFMMCAAALGDPLPAEDAVEKAETTKAALVKALRASTAYCAKAYGQSAVEAAGSAELFGEKSSRFHALTLNAIHDGEHYGNIITYMRMKGLVPPSSRR